jgi:hypothetical protein
MVLAPPESNSSSRHPGRTRTTRRITCSANRRIAKRTCTPPTLAHHQQRRGDNPTNRAVFSRRVHLLSLTGSLRCRCKRRTRRRSLRSSRVRRSALSHSGESPPYTRLDLSFLVCPFYLRPTGLTIMVTEFHRSLRGTHLGIFVDLVSWRRSASRFCFSPAPWGEVLTWQGKDMVGGLGLSNVV